MKTQIKANNKDAKKIVAKNRRAVSQLGMQDDKGSQKNYIKMNLESQAGPLKEIRSSTKTFALQMAGMQNSEYSAKRTATTNPGTRHNKLQPIRNFNGMVSTSIERGSQSISPEKQNLYQTTKFLNDEEQDQFNHYGDINYQTRQNRQQFMHFTKSGSSMSKQRPNVQKPQFLGLKNSLHEMNAQQSKSSLYFRNTQGSTLNHNQKSMTLDSMQQINSGAQTYQNSPQHPETWKMSAVHEDDRENHQLPSIRPKKVEVSKRLNKSQLNDYQEFGPNHLQEESSSHVTHQRVQQMSNQNSININIQKNKNHQKRYDSSSTQQSKTKGVSLAQKLSIDPRQYDIQGHQTLVHQDPHTGRDSSGEPSIQGRMNVDNVNMLDSARNSQRTQENQRNFEEHSRNASRQTSKDRNRQKNGHKCAVGSLLETIQNNEAKRKDQIMKAGLNANRKDMRELQQQIDHFNQNRQVTQYQKIQIILKQTPALQNTVDADDFNQKESRRRGIPFPPKEVEDTLMSDPRTIKVNRDMLIYEQMFENRRNLNIKRPKIKDSVLGKLKNGLATPALLIMLKRNTKEIDDYLAKTCGVIPSKPIREEQGESDQEIPKKSLQEPQIKQIDVNRIQNDQHIQISSFLTQADPTDEFYSDEKQDKISSLNQPLKTVQNTARLQGQMLATTQGATSRRTQPGMNSSRYNSKAKFTERRHQSQMTNHEGSIFNTTTQKIQEIINFDQADSTRHKMNNSALIQSYDIMESNRKTTQRSAFNRSTLDGYNSIEQSTDRKNTSRVQPYQALCEIPKASPFLPAHLKYLDNYSPSRMSQDISPQKQIEKFSEAYSYNKPKKQDLKDLDKNQKEKIQDLNPNFLKAMFTFLEEHDEEFLADPKQYEHFQQMFNNFYNVTSEKDLDKKNPILNFAQKCKDQTLRANTQSLTTVGACSDVINQVLISQHQPWVQKMHEKFVKQTKQEVKTETVYDRINMDQLYRRQKEYFLNWIQTKSQSGGKGFLEKHVNNKFKSKKKKTGHESEEELGSPGIKPSAILKRDESELITVSTIIDMQNTDQRFNDIDFEAYIRDGGKVKDLISAKKFEVIYREIQSYLKLSYGNKKSTFKQEIDSQKRNKKIIADQISELVSQSAFNVMLEQQLQCYEETQKLKHKNQLLNDGTRIGQAHKNILGKYQSLERRKAFKRNLLYQGDVAEQELFDLINYKGAKKDTQEPQKRDRFFVAQINQLQSEMDKYYDQYGHLYETVREMGKENDSINDD